MSLLRNNVTPEKIRKAMSRMKTSAENKNENFMRDVLALLVRKAMKQLTRSGKNASRIKRMGMRYLKDLRRDFAKLVLIDSFPHFPIAK
jgi:hypothetical protein